MEPLSTSEPVCGRYGWAFAVMINEAEYEKKKKKKNIRTKKERTKKKNDESDKKMVFFSDQLQNYCKCKYCFFDIINVCITWPIVGGALVVFFVNACISIANIVTVTWRALFAMAPIPTDHAANYSEANQQKQNDD